MKRKWIAGCLVCLLLLCGTGVLSAQAKTLRIKAVVFEDVDTYRETVGTVCSKEELDDLFWDKPGAPVQIDQMTMLLEDRFLLIPKVQGESFEEVSFLGSGTSVFWTILPDGCNFTVRVEHGKSDINDLYADLEKDTFETVDGHPVFHWFSENKDRKARSDTYYLEINGYLARIFENDFCPCEKDAVKNLTFEKVEIKQKEKEIGIMEKTKAYILQFLRFHGVKLLCVTAAVVLLFFVPIARSPMQKKPTRMEIYRYDQKVTVNLTPQDPAFHTVYRSLKRTGATYLYQVPAILFAKKNVVQDSYRASLWLGVYRSDEERYAWQNFIIIRAYYDETQTVPRFFNLRQQSPYTELAFVLAGEKTPADNALYGENEPCVNYYGPRSNDGTEIWQAFSTWGNPKRAVRVIDKMGNTQM